MGRPLGKRLISVAAASLLASFALVGSAGAVSPRPTCSRTWQIVPSPTPGRGADTLFAVYSASPTSAWAVGDFHTGSGVGLPGVEHWDGASWSTVKVPSVSPVENVFYAVSGTSSSDVWAAGNEYDTTISQWKPLVEHWDGTSWSIFTTPDLGPGSWYISGVAAISPTDAWLVGYGGSPDSPITEHWDGTSWTAVPATGGDLNAVTALSSDDVWAVGQGPKVVLHWDGVSWTSFQVPGAGYLLGAAGLSGADVWAVGADAEDPTQAVADHWDGSQWSESFSNHYSSQNVLSAVAASSPTDVWAVGNRYQHSVFRTFVEHFDGAGWSVVPSPNVNRRDDLLQGVAVDSTPGAWAVGWWSQRGIARTLIERYC